MTFNVSAFIPGGGGGLHLLQFTMIIPSLLIITTQLEINPAKGNSLLLPILHHPTIYALTMAIVFRLMLFSVPPPLT